ncbi:MAG: response regulator [Dehalococcoidia bacterium]
MAKDKVLVALGDNLFFTGKIDNVAGQLEYRMEVAQNPLELTQKVGQDRPDLIILDLSTEEVDWAETIKGLKAASPDTPILAFGPHTEEQLLKDASEAGCDAVVTKGAFSRELPDLIRKLGGDSLA